MGSMKAYQSILKGDWEWPEFIVGSGNRSQTSGIKSLSSLGIVDAMIANSNITVLLGLVTTLISYLWLFRLGQRKHVGPKSWPILGCYLEVRANYYRLHDWVTAYMKSSPSSTVSANILGSRYIWIGRPDNVEFVLKSNFANFPKGVLAFERLEDFLGNGIFVADGDVWKQHRKIASFEFSNRKLRDFSTDAYRGHALRLVYILDGAAVAGIEVDFQDLAMRMTLDSICKIGFGVDYGALSADLPDVSFAKSFDKATVLVQRRQFGFMWKLKRMLNVGSEKQLREEVGKLNKFTYEVIGARRAELLALEISGQELERPDLLSRFMTTKDANGELLSDRVLRDAVLNFVIAGRDTSAITLSWFVYCLCTNPRVAEKCYEETLHVFGELQGHENFDHFVQLLTYESLGKLNYFHAALTETLRLYPAVPKDGKYALNDCVLPDGTFVKRGTTVTFHPYGMGRLESLWGADAEEFKPERWLADGVFHAESLFKFTAFQAGPRVCLGKDTAYIQMKMTAALLVRFFRFQLVPNHPIQYQISLVMPLLHGIRITLSRRAQV